MTALLTNNSTASSLCASRALFLDFDGVLHPVSDDDETPLDVQRAKHFCWAPLLESLLEPHPEVAIVVHSSWRYSHNERVLRGLLGALARGRFAGAAPFGPKYAAIVSWLHLNPDVTSYRILDDDRHRFPAPAPPELILCDPDRGVSDERVLTELRRWLVGDVPRPLSQSHL